MSIDWLATNQTTSYQICVILSSLEFNYFELSIQLDVIKSKQASLLTNNPLAVKTFRSSTILAYYYEVVPFGSSTSMRLLPVMNSTEMRRYLSRMKRVNTIKALVMIELNVFLINPFNYSIEYIEQLILNTILVSRIKYQYVIDQHWHLLEEDEVRLST